MVHKVLLITLLAAAAVADVVPYHEVHHAPQPYSFGYSVKDKHGEQHRQEAGDGHSNVKGSYGFSDDRGVKRQVEYVADKAGFRAQVKTNEPGTANQDPAAVDVISSAHPYFGAGYGHGYGGYGLGYAGYGHGYAGYGGLGYAGNGGHGYAGYKGHGFPGYGGLGYAGYNGLYGGYGKGYGNYGHAGLGYGDYYAGYGY